MISAIQIVFFVSIPIILIIYRIRKKINTSFAVYGIIASLALGLLLVGTFLKERSVEFVDLLNQNRYEDAKRSLRLILQKNPEELSKIDETRIIKKKAFEKIKKELETEYLEIADDTMAAKIEADNDCKSLVKMLHHQDKLDHGMRLLNMAEAIGKKQDEKKEMLKSAIKRQKEIVDGLEDRCR